MAALYNTEMTSVYSGGLVYEYSQETSNYGLVEINGDSVTERADFTALETALKNTTDPSGTGGYNATGGASGCPAYDPPNWAVMNDTLPAIPDDAKQYMTNGAGKGPGLEGKGSQNAGGSASTGTATAGSGDVTATASASSSGSASSSTESSSSSNGAGGVSPASSFIPGIICGVITIATLSGAFLL